MDSDLWVLCTLPMDDEMFMPPENDPLSSTDLFLLRRWIEEGADWPESKLAPKRKVYHRYACKGFIQRIRIRSR